MANVPGVYPVAGRPIFFAAVLSLAGCASVTLEEPVALDAARCKSLRGELDDADTRGMPTLADKASNGGSLSAAQRQQVDAYNDALQAYLAGQCHTQGKP